MNFFICGFTGAGKSYALDKLKSMSFHRDLIFNDLDKLIENEVGLTVADFIEKKGIEEFRRVEKTVLFEIFSLNNQFIALGGGAFNSLTQDILGEFTGFWLDTPFETCFERIKGDKSRPMGQKPKLEIKTIYNQRLSFYKKVIKVKDFSEIATYLDKELGKFT